MVPIFFQHCPSVVRETPELRGRKLKLDGCVDKSQTMTLGPHCQCLRIENEHRRKWSPLLPRGVGGDAPGARSGGGSVPPKRSPAGGHRPAGRSVGGSVPSDRATGSAPSLSRKIKFHVEDTTTWLDKGPAFQHTPTARSSKLAGFSTTNMFRRNLTPMRPSDAQSGANDPFRIARIAPHPCILSKMFHKPFKLWVGCTE